MHVRCQRCGWTTGDEVPVRGLIVRLLEHWGERHGGVPAPEVVAQ